MRAFGVRWAARRVGRPRLPRRPRIGAREALRRGVAPAVGAVGGALWWWAALRFALRPESAGAWEGALLAGGWSLGLIPLHAVPVRRCSGESAPALAPGGLRPGEPPAGEAVGR